MNANEIIQRLLDNPYPHDLMAIRKLAESYGSEEEAKEKMVAYCTIEFLVDALADHYAAQGLAKAWLKEHQ